MNRALRRLVLEILEAAEAEREADLIAGVLWRGPRFDEGQRWNGRPFSVEREYRQARAMRED